MLHNIRDYLLLIYILIGNISSIFSEYKILYS